MQLQRLACRVFSQVRDSFCELERCRTQESLASLGDPSAELHTLDLWGLA